MGTSLSAAGKGTVSAKGQWLVWPQGCEGCEAASRERCGSRPAPLPRGPRQASLRSPTEQGPGDQGAPRSSSAASPSCYSCPLGGQRGRCSQPGASEPALGCLLHLL